MIMLLVLYTHNLFTFLYYWFYLYQILILLTCAKSLVTQPASFNVFEDVKTQGFKSSLLQFENYHEKFTPMAGNHLLQ